jgi:hypothetical protein
LFKLFGILDLGMEEFCFLESPREFKRHMPIEDPMLFGALFFAC